MSRLILSSILLLHLLRGSAVRAQNGSTDVLPYNFNSTGALTGEQRIWHKITIGFEGPETTETDSPNPFADYRLDVNFTHAPSRKAYLVPGYFAADGNAANSGANAGSVWLVHFAPDEVGTWEWEATFVEGENVAQNGGGTSASFFDGATGTFKVDATNKSGRDHRGKGRLEYVGEHHLRFAGSGGWFLKAGTDSPENFLQYEDFDNTFNATVPLKTWAAHERDFNAQNGDPTWAEGKGSEIIGALNYLANEGLNAFSFIPLTIGGDAKSVHPYVSDDPNDFLRMDCSKLAQWEVVFEHADRKGLFIHFKTQEEENDQLLDGGELGNERKLFYREFIARFGHHLALNWNLGEENTNTALQREQFSDYIKSIDPYHHPIVSHSVSTEKEETYGPLLGHPTFDGASLNAELQDVFAHTLEWVQRSAAAGRKWIVTSDEQGSKTVGVVPDSLDPLHDNIRMHVLWGNLMAGGAGVEYYFGGTPSCSDLSCQDYRSRANAWKQARYALDFFSRFSIPFWDMSNANDRLTNDDWLLADSNDNVLLLYRKEGGSESAAVDLSPSAEDGDLYFVDWFDPRNGGPLQYGTVKLLPAKNAQSLGIAPNNQEKDWVVLLRKCADCSPEGTETGLIAGIVVACVFAVAFALLYFRSWYVNKQQSMSIEKDRDEEPQLQHESEDAVPQQVNPELGTVYAVAVATMEVDTSGGPEYKDQVRRSGGAQKPMPTPNTMDVDNSGGPEYKDQVRHSGRAQKPMPTPNTMDVDNPGGPEYKDQVRKSGGTQKPMPAPNTVEEETESEQAAEPSRPSASFIKDLRLEI